MPDGRGWSMLLKREGAEVSFAGITMRPGFNAKAAARPRTPKLGAKPLVGRWGFSGRLVRRLLWR